MGTNLNDFNGRSQTTNLGVVSSNLFGRAIFRDIPCDSHGIRTYALSLAGILAVGFLLLVSMLMTAALAAVGKRLAPYLPEVTLQLVGFFLSFGIISLLFAMMFKWLPDTPVAWSDVRLGAIVTAALFELGKLAIGLYIGKQGLESTYGAAASIVVVLIWVYYSSQIVLMGAEFTNVYARRYGSLRRTLSSMQNRND